MSPSVRRGRAALARSAGRHPVPGDAWRSCAATSGAEPVCRSLLVRPLPGRPAGHSTLGVIGLSTRQLLTVVRQSSAEPAQSSRSRPVVGRTPADASANRRYGRIGGAPSCSAQGERHELIARLRAPLCSAPAGAARRDDDVLLAVNRIRARRCVSAGGELVLPEDLAGPGVERPKFFILRRADE